MICECSSFQLEDTEAFAPEVAVLLNVTPDHLDRHGTLEAYREAKLRIFAGQGDDDFAIFDADLGRLRRLRAARAAARRSPTAARPAPRAAAWSASATSVIEADGRPLCPLGELALPGEHNVRNAMAVSRRGALRRRPRARRSPAGCAASPACRTGSSASPRSAGVLYVNDSKATNVAAAEAALRSFDGGVHAILGGSLKGGSFDGLVSRRRRALPRRLPDRRGAPTRSRRRWPAAGVSS